MSVVTLILGVGGGSGIGAVVGGVGVGVGGVYVEVCKNGSRSLSHEETNCLYSPGHLSALSCGNKPSCTKSLFNEVLLP